MSGTFISQDNFLLPEPGIYKIQISVYSKNAVHKTKEFIVTWRGGWRKTQSEMQKRLEIEMLYGLRKGQEGMRMKKEETRSQENKTHI